MEESIGLVPCPGNENNKKSEDPRRAVLYKEGGKSRPRSFTSALKIAALGLSSSSSGRGGEERKRSPANTAAPAPKPAGHSATSSSRSLKSPKTRPLAAAEQQIKPGTLWCRAQCYFPEDIRKAVCASPPQNRCAPDLPSPKSAGEKQCPRPSLSSLPIRLPAPHTAQRMVPPGVSPRQRVALSSTHSRTMTLFVYRSPSRTGFFLTRFLMCRHDKAAAPSARNSPRLSVVADAYPSSRRELERRPPRRVLEAVIR